MYPLWCASIYTVLSWAFLSLYSSGTQTCGFVLLFLFTWFGYDSNVSFVEGFGEFRPGIFLYLEGFSLLFQSPRYLCVCLGCGLLGLILVVWLDLETHLFFFPNFPVNEVQVFKIFPYSNLSFFGVYCNASSLIPDTINLGLSSLWLVEPSVCQSRLPSPRRLGWLTLHYSAVCAALVSGRAFVISCHWLHLDSLCSWFSKRLCCFPQPLHVLF